MRTLATLRVPSVRRNELQKKEFGNVGKEFIGQFRGKIWESLTINAQAMSFGFKDARTTMFFPQGSISCFSLTCGGSDTSREDWHLRTKPLIVFGSKEESKIDAEDSNPLIVSPGDIEWRATFRDPQTVTRILSFCYDQPMSIEVDTARQLGDEVSNLASIAFTKRPEIVVFAQEEKTGIYQVV